MGSVLITSRLGEDYRGDLEQVMSFNTEQNYVENAIRYCMQDFRVPEIFTENGFLRVRFELFSIAHTLFLIDRTAMEEDILAGTIVCVRDGRAARSVLHVAIAEDYINQGPVTSPRLVWDLLRHVIASASHISGIKNLELVYGNFLGKGRSKLVNIPVMRALNRNSQKQHTSSECPDASITCYVDQRCFDCPQQFISTTRERMMNRADSRSGH